MLTDLHNLRVLVVEDDPLVALDVASALADSGATVVGPAQSVAEAMHLLDQQTIDAAVLDFRLRDETSTSIAHRLFREHRPFLFHSGSQKGPQHLNSNVMIVAKPSQPDELIAAVKALLAAAG